MSAAAVAAATASSMVTTAATAVIATASVSAAMIAATCVAAMVAGAAVSAVVAITTAIAIAAAIVAAAIAAPAVIPAPAVPGTYAEEDSVIEPLRAVVAVGSAGVGRVIVIAPLTGGWAGNVTVGITAADAYADGNLGLRRGRRCD